MNNQNLSENFIEKNFIEKNIMNDDLWFILSKKQKFTKNFMIKYHKNLFWNEIFISNKINEEFIIYIYDNLNNDYIEWDLILKYQSNLTSKFLDKYFNEFDELSINNLCKYQNLTYDFINKRSKKLNWYILLSKQKVNEELHQPEFKMKQQ
jgi:hypothetical protein